jgi:hypothetical protein
MQAGAGRMVITGLKRIDKKSRGVKKELRSRCFAIDSQNSWRIPIPFDNRLNPEALKIKDNNYL